MICPVCGTKNVLREEMVVFSTSIMDMSLKLELDSVGGVLSGNGKLIKKRAYKKQTKQKIKELIRRIQKILWMAQLARSFLEFHISCHCLWL